MLYTLEDVGIKLLSDYEDYRQKIEATIKPCVKFDTEHRDKEQLTWWQSKAGGFPYFPKGSEYPTGKDGSDMDFVAQINWAEVPNLNGFPYSGILEFYVAQVGSIWDEAYDYECKVLYFSQLDFQVVNLITDFDFLSNFENRLVDSLAFTNFTNQLEINTILINKAFEEEDFGLEEIIEDDSCSLVLGNKIGGNSQSFQGATLSYSNVEMGETDELLLQLQTDTWSIHFFIQKSQLHRLDFSNVVFYFDAD